MLINSTINQFTYGLSSENSLVAYPSPSLLNTVLTRQNLRSVSTPVSNFLTTITFIIESDGSVLCVITSSSSFHKNKFLYEK